MVTERKYRRPYTIRPTIQGKRAWTTSVPADLLADVAERYGMSIFEFVAAYNAQWSLDEQSRAYVEFVKRDGDRQE